MGVRTFLASMACVVAVVFGTAAGAQSAPAPVGYWVTADGSEMLLVSETGCKFAASNGFTVLGKCGWNPTSRGGILTIMNVYNYNPAPIRYNIVWVNQKTITVWGDVFYKRG